MISDEECSRLVSSMYAGSVFGTWMLPKSDFPLIKHIFLPLALGVEPPDDIDSIYEYLDQAGPRAINGYPTFFSMRILTHEDRPKVLEKIAKLEEALG